MNMIHYGAILSYIILFLIGKSWSAQDIELDGFVDLYYSYDFNRPQSGDREFTTQPARHNEFNVNLALLGMTYQKERTTLRLSLQAGTYVQSNYLPEPRRGEISGPDLVRHMQDAYLKIQLGDRSEIIAGIMPSHIGYESVFSIDNFTYTRSLAADYSPYYQSGLGFIHQLSREWSFEAYILNGWQNVSEDDSHKALGSALRWQKDRWQVNYANYFGHFLREARHFHDFNFQYGFNDHFSLKALFDIGFHQLSDRRANFYTYNIQAYWHLDPSNAFNLRYERYRDNHEAHIPTALGDGFNVSGASIGFDHLIERDFMLRLEYRWMQAAERIFQNRQNFAHSNQNLVVSLASKF